MKKIIPYPLRATRINISINPFGFWMPSFVYKKDLSEKARKNGDGIWWLRFAWFQVSYSRWI